jgi:DNA polymerase-3 subunit gamma/tau
VNYEVFARKYRPQTFDDLVGQTHVSRTLKNAVAQNRLAHAYLFVGPRGVGKTSTAQFWQSLNYQASMITLRGVCDNCREIAGGNSLDVSKSTAQNNSVEDVPVARERSVCTCQRALQNLSSTRCTLSSARSTRF